MLMAQTRPLTTRSSVDHELGHSARELFAIAPVLRLAAATLTSRTGH